MDEDDFDEAVGTVPISSWTLLIRSICISYVAVPGRKQTLFSSRILNASLHLKRGISELSLRAELKRCVNTATIDAFTQHV